MITVFYYPKCSTCIRALKWLREQGIEFNERHIVEEVPTAGELREILNKSGLPIKKLFNVSGKVYKEMNIKDKLDSMSDDEKISLLAGNGMLIKRPLVLGEDFSLIGFKESEWVDKLC